MAKTVVVAVVVVVVVGVGVVVECMFCDPFFRGLLGTSNPGISKGYTMFYTSPNRRRFRKFRGERVSDFDRFKEQDQFRTGLDGACSREVLMPSSNLQRSTIRDQGIQLEASQVPSEKVYVDLSGEYPAIECFSSENSPDIHSPHSIDVKICQAPPPCVLLPPPRKRCGKPPAVSLFDPQKTHHNETIE